MLPRIGPHQQQQQQQDQQALAVTGRYTLLSCFKELPSVNTAPPPMAIAVQHMQPQPCKDKLPVQQQELSQQPECAGTSATAAAQSPGAAAATAARSATSLADIPAAALAQLLSLLTSRDLAALALTCRGLRAATWEAVPGLKLVLYPHQRNALSWMLHREVNGGQRVEHPYMRQYVTGGDGGCAGWPVYLNQVGAGQTSCDMFPW
jgi:hypothetical protein